MITCDLHGTAMRKGTKTYYCPAKDFLTGEYCNFTKPLSTVDPNPQQQGVTALGIITPAPKDWDAIATGKTASLFMAARLQSGNINPTSALGEVDAIIALATAIVNKTSGKGASTPAPLIGTKDLY